MQQCLALAGAAEQIARLAILLYLPDMSADGLPALDLAAIFLRHAAAEGVAAVPLKPAARIVLVQPALLLPDRQRLARVDTEVVERAVTASLCELGAFEPAGGNSFRQSVMYFPQNTPSRSICAGVRSGSNSGSKPRPAGAVKA